MGLEHVVVGPLEAKDILVGLISGIVSVMMDARSINRNAGLTPVPAPPALPSLRMRGGSYTSFSSVNSDFYRKIKVTFGTA